MNGDGNKDEDGDDYRKEKIENFDQNVKGVYSFGIKKHTKH